MAGEEDNVLRVLVENLSSVDAAYAFVRYHAAVSRRVSEALQAGTLPELSDAELREIIACHDAYPPKAGSGSLRVVWKISQHVILANAKHRFGFMKRLFALSPGEALSFAEVAAALCTAGLYDGPLGRAENILEMYPLSFRDPAPGMGGFSLKLSDLVLLHIFAFGAGHRPLYAGTVAVHPFYLAAEMASGTCFSRYTPSDLVRNSYLEKVAPATYRLKDPAAVRELLAAARRSVRHGVVAEPDYDPKEPMTEAPSPSRPQEPERSIGALYVSPWSVPLENGKKLSIGLHALVALHIMMQAPDEAMSLEAICESPFNQAVRKRSAPGAANEKALGYLVKRGLVEKTVAGDFRLKDPAAIKNILEKSQLAAKRRAAHAVQRRARKRVHAQTRAPR